MTFVKDTLPSKTLLRLLNAAPSLAWIEKVGAASPPSCAKRTWLAVKSAVVNVVALTQLMPSVVVWNVPLLTLVTVNVKLELSGSVTPISAGAISTVPPSDTVSDAAVMTGGELMMMIIGDSTVPTNTLLRLLTLAPSSAWIEKVGVKSLTSRTKRTCPAFRSALVNVVASVHVAPSAVVCKTP